MPQKDYYKILGVSRDTGPKEIRDAFRKLAKKYHPDKAGPEGKDQFQDVQEAYEVLSDPERRTSYDKTLKEEGHIPRRRPTRYRPDTWYTSPFRIFSQRRSAQRQPNPDLVLILSREEAQRGQAVDVQIPLYVPCPHCGGRGETWFFPCMMCFGEGRIRERKRIRLNIPPGVKDGSMMDIPVQTIGTLPLYLHVLIEIH